MRNGCYVIEKVTCLVKPSETARTGPSRIVDDVAVDTALINCSGSLDSRSSPLPQDSWLKIESKTFGFQRSLICTKSRFGIESFQGNPEGEIVLFLFSLLVCYICLLIFRGEGGFTTKLYAWRLCNTIQPLIISYTIFPGKLTSFVYL